MSFNHLPIVAEDTALWGAWMAKNKGWAHLQILARLKFFQHKNPGKLQGTAFYCVGKKGKRTP